MSEINKGDKVEVIDASGDHKARVGDKGIVTRIHNPEYKELALLTVCLEHGGTIEMYKKRFKLITMEDKEITTKVSRVLEAHVKGCSTVKQTLEILHPECFEKKYNPKKIYAIKNDYKDIFVLHQIESGRYAFLKITSDSFHDRVFQSGEDALKAYSTIVSFDTQRDFFSWCHIVL